MPKKTFLSDAAVDVIYALFFRGALPSGDLPSKSGTAELRSLGFVETRHSATKYHGENYFTFLTAQGSAFAIQYFVDTSFVEEKNSEGTHLKNMTIKLAIDTSDAVAALDELAEKIQKNKFFQALSGQIFMNECCLRHAPECKFNIENDHLITRTIDSKIINHLCSILSGNSLIRESNASGPYQAQAELCSFELPDRIERRTLSAVLGSTLPAISLSDADTVAAKLARAVKTAFDELDKPNATAS